MSFSPNRLKQLRKEKGVSLREVAQACNISKSAIDMYESGKRTPKRENVEALAQYFHTSVEYLLDNPLYNYDDITNSAAARDFIYHYTCFDSLQQIITNKSLLLKRADLLNDLTENRNISKEWAHRVYVACFTHHAHESWFFWQTYTKDISQGVLISLPTSAFKDSTIHPDATCNEPSLSRKKATHPTPFNENVSSADWYVKNATLLDVKYLSRKDAPQSCENNFQGACKYIEWDLENETRFRVAIHPNCLGVERKKTNLLYQRPVNENLFLKLSREHLESMIITLSPFADDSLKHRLETLLKENNLLDKVQVIPSILTGEV